MINEQGNGITKRTAFGILSVLVMFALPLTGFAASEEPPAETHDGLVLVPDRNVWAAYTDPDADFSGYDKVMILDCYVAFIKDWERGRKTGSRLPASESDMERIKAEVAGSFREVFSEVLTEGGYEVVHSAGEDVLLIRPAIIDLDVTAPDNMSAGRTRTYTASSGAATLYVELFDSVTGAILARAVDRKSAQTAGRFLSYTNRVTNRSDARRAFRGWAELLEARLDEFKGGDAKE